ncbi:hypothetical protein DXG01_013873 [Tephrocybe rancida]|nr:hypothetical protein DXG01_013873 [Tephrocybe rancida]
MHPSLRVLSSRVHQPLIKFLGKRLYPNSKLACLVIVVKCLDIASSAPSTPHAHPAAPAELKSRFAEFVKKFEASGPTASTTLASKSVLGEFWDAPERLWKQDIEEAEIDAILSGGASLH